MPGMDYSDLKMQVGEMLQLQARDGEDSRRMQVKLIGYLPGVSLLVTTPKVGDKVMIIREGQPYVVRMMIGNRIVGFATTVLRSCARPFPYLHLAYPGEVEQITVRKAQRVRVKLFASLKNANPDFQFEKRRTATIVDMSTAGALMVANQPLGEVGDAVTVNCALKIGGAEKLLSVPAFIRNVHVGPSEEHGEGSYYHGLEFAVKDQQDAFILHGFVYEQIVKAQSE
jgi:c-di-GMP-binding flagellar brake protein YcgR